MSKNWPKMRLDKVLIPVNRPALVEPTALYSILGAHWYAKGLYTKDVSQGAEIQAKYLYRVEEGDFVYNRLFGWERRICFGVQRECRLLRIERISLFHRKT